MNKAITNKIANCVQGLLNEHNVNKPPVPVDKIAKKLGAKLQYSPLDKELSGMVYIKDGTPIIGVNALHHANRQRFTIAHELGHICLHKKHISKEVHVDKNFPMLMRDTKASEGIDEIEIQANSFAAELLMPESLLRAELENHTFDIDDDSFVMALSKKFKVSSHAIQLRLGKILNN